MRNCQIKTVINERKNITEKIYLLKMSGPNSDLFIYGSTHCVETVKWLDYI